LRSWIPKEILRDGGQKTWRLFKMMFEMYMLAVIHWEIDGKTGHGSAVPYESAVAWVEQMNEKYGEGTHWLKRVR
jgi:hypothetical protein